MEIIHITHPSLGSFDWELPPEAVRALAALAPSERERAKLILGAHARIQLTLGLAAICAEPQNMHEALNQLGEGALSAAESFVRTTRIHPP